MWDICIFTFTRNNNFLSAFWWVDLYLTKAHLSEIILWFYCEHLHNSSILVRFIIHFLLPCVWPGNLLIVKLFYSINTMKTIYWYINFFTLKSNSGVTYYILCKYGYQTDRCTLWVILLAIKSFQNVTQGVKKMFALSQTRSISVCFVPSNLFLHIYIVLDTSLTKRYAHL